MKRVRGKRRVGLDVEEDDKRRRPTAKGIDVVTPGGEGKKEGLETQGKRDRGRRAPDRRRRRLKNEQGSPRRG